jgi:ABC-2 type transport system ATP-binding protein
MPALEETIVAENLTKRFGKQTAIRDLNFSISKGEIVGFLGPNGAGKSTTLRMLTGLLPASSGKLSVCGFPVATNPHAVKGLIGYMPENNPLPEDMRVGEYLAFRAGIKGIPLRERKKRIGHALEVCELQHRAKGQIIGTLSKGFRQRVGIADAILAAPPITILDEPTIGLDPHQVLATRRLLDQLRGETTVIFSSHILSEVEISCDRILILNQGNLVAKGTADELREEFIPGSRYRLTWQGSLENLQELLQTSAPEWEILESESSGNTSVATIKHPQHSTEGHALLKLLIHEQLDILTFEKRNPSLEEIFLTATQRSWNLSTPTTLSRKSPTPQEVNQ